MDLLNRFPGNIWFQVPSATAYLHFKSQQSLLAANSKLEGHKMLDARGKEYRCCLLNWLNMPPSRAFIHGIAIFTHSQDSRRVLPVPEDTAQESHRQVHTSPPSTRCTFPPRVDCPPVPGHAHLARSFSQHRRA